MHKPYRLFKFFVLFVAVFAFVGCAMCQTCQAAKCKKCDECPEVAAKYATASISYPTESKLLLEKNYPELITLGKEYEYTITATNLTDLQLTDVKVIEVMPDAFTLISSEPAVTTTEGAKTIWNLGALPAKKSATIKVMGKAAAKQDLPSCTSAEYNVYAALCLETKVVQPGLAVSVRAPEQVTACETIPLVYTVKNTGDSAICNVVLTGDLPSGVTTTKGQGVITESIGTLKAGEVQEVKAVVQAKEPGSYAFGANARSEKAQLEVSAASVSTAVVKPRLSVNVTSNTATTYVGRPMNFTVSVQNVGNCVSENTVLEAVIPANARLSEAAGGAASGRTVRWNIGALEAGASKEYNLQLLGGDSGSAMVEASATGLCADAATSSASTEIKGIPALLIEVIDIYDPIEVGANETYQIVVTNQGSATAHNIKLVAELEGMTFVSGNGPTNVSAMGDTVNIEPLATLAPKANATWNVIVTGVKAGDLRFKVIMTGDDLTRSVEETESTHVY